MDVVKQIIDGAERLVGALKTAALPHQIVETFPADHPLAGQPARTFLLRREAEGCFRYEAVDAPRGMPGRLAPLAEHVIKHRFDALSDIAEFLNDHEGAAVFLAGVRYREHEVRAVLDPERPEIGAVTLPLSRHPAWLRWMQGFGDGRAVDLAPADLADVLRDNEEDLEVPMLARALSVLRATADVQQDTDADSGDVSGVRWKIRTGKEGTAEVPRDLAAKFPAFCGAWEAGNETQHVARYRLRVLPPKGDVPLRIRVMWVNAADYEQQARAALTAAVRAALPRHAVYLGHPDVTRYVVP